MIGHADDRNVGFGRLRDERSRFAPIMVVETESEQSLIAQTKLGSHTAFAELIRRNHSVLKAVLGRYLRDNDEVDELAQRSFVAAFRSIENFRGDASFSTWLISIARRQTTMFLRDESRRRKHETTAAELAVIQMSAESSDDLNDVDGKLATLAKCLDRLPKGSRDIVNQYYFEQDSIASIASNLKRSRGAVRMLLLRIRRSLANCISKRLSEGQG